MRSVSQIVVMIVKSFRLKWKSKSSLCFEIVSPVAFISLFIAAWGIFTATFEKENFQGSNSSLTDSKSNPFHHFLPLKGIDHIYINSE